MARKSSSPQKQSNGANLGFEAKLWQAVDKMRGHMHASVYKGVLPDFPLLHVRRRFEEHSGARLDRWSTRAAV